MRRFKLFSLVIVAAVSIVGGCNGCFQQQAYDAATVANFQKVKEWEALERKKLDEVFDRAAAAAASDEDKKFFSTGKNSMALRHDALTTVLDTAISAEQAKQGK